MASGALREAFGARPALAVFGLAGAGPSGAEEALQGFEGLPVQRLRGRDRPVGVWAWPAPAEA